MKQILLTRGFVAVVDDEDFDALSRYRWHAKGAGSHFYARRNLPGVSKCITMHRQLLDAPLGDVGGPYQRQYSRQQKVQSASLYVLSKCTKPPKSGVD
jgi:hypothetical protein